MTRLELLRLLVGRARKNGFAFRRWYTSKMGLPWISGEAALVVLDTQRRYYALVYSLDFAQAFWRPGSEISFDVPQKTFQRVMHDGSVRTIHSKPYIRRSLRPLAWKYHLRQMALAEDPLRYLRKYLHIEEDLDPDQDGQPATKNVKKPVRKAAMKKPSGRSGKEPRLSLSSEIPAFLQRPYRPFPSG